MKTSRESLVLDARAQGYKPEILEKVYRLLDTFFQLMSVPFLKDRLVLKGGTALNLFCFDSVPRLSVDIDLNYIGALDRETMLRERPVLNDAIFQILQQNQFERYRAPNHHAGGKMIWYYNSVLGQRGALEIDINYMYRQPLWPITYRAAQMKGFDDWRAPMLDIHELAAGKLSALFGRNASRDLYDAHHLMQGAALDMNKLRLTFTTYLAMTKIDLESLTPESIQYDLADLRNRLLPVLQQGGLPRSQLALKSWATTLVDELREKLSMLLPLSSDERAFIKNIRDHGLVMPELITDDVELANKIKVQPALHWVAKQRS